MCALSPQDPGRSRYLVYECRFLEGELDDVSIRSAFADVVSRHDALRLVFDFVGYDPTLHIDSAVEPPVEFIDLSTVSESRQRARLEQLVFDANRVCFDLRAGPPWRAWLIRVGAATHYLMLSFAHVVVDAWSRYIFVRDLIAAYGARVGRLPPLPDNRPSFAEIHATQTRRLEPSPDRLRYWRSGLLPLQEGAAFTLRDAPPGADLLARSRITFPLPATAAQLKRVAWRARTTPFVALMAAYQVLLSVLTGRERTVIAGGTLARPTTSEREAIGQFVNDVFVPVHVRDGSSLLNVAIETHRAFAGGLENMVPYKALARALNPAFESNRPWAQCHLHDGIFYQGLDDVDLELARIRVSPGQIPSAPPANHVPELVAADLTDRLRPVYEAWCGPRMVVSTRQGKAVLLFNKEVQAPEAMRTLRDRYLSIVETLVNSPETTVGALRRRHGSHSVA